MIRAASCAFGRNADVALLDVWGGSRPGPADGHRQLQDSHIGQLHIGKPVAFAQFWTRVNVFLFLYIRCYTLGP